MDRRLDAGRLREAYEPAARAFGLLGSSDAIKFLDAAERQRGGRREGAAVNLGVVGSSGATDTTRAVIPCVSGWRERTNGLLRSGASQGLRVLLNLPHGLAICSMSLRVPRNMVCVNQTASWHNWSLAGQWFRSSQRSRTSLG